MRAQERKLVENLRRAVVIIFNDLCASGDLSESAKAKAAELLRRKPGEQADE